MAPSNSKRYANKFSIEWYEYGMCKRASSVRKLELIDKALKKKEEAAEKEKLSQEQENNIENKKKRLKLM